MWTHINKLSHTLTHSLSHTPSLSQSYKEYTMVDIGIWMKAVQIDAYYDLLFDFGIKKGADLKYIGDSELQVHIQTLNTHTH